MLDKTSVFAAFQHLFTDPEKTYDVDAARCSPQLVRRQSYRAIGTEHVKEALALSRKSFSTTEFNNSKSDNSFPLTEKSEIRTGMTPALFKKMVRNTQKCESGDPVTIINISCNGSDMWRTSYSANKIRRFEAACPNLRSMTLTNANFLHKMKNRRVKLSDFPKHLTEIIVQGSVIDLETFFTTKRGHLTVKLLDLTHCIFVPGKVVSNPGSAWTPMPELEELYLAGSPFFDHPSYLSTILQCCTSLRVLDLEGTEISDKDLLEICEKAGGLQELYLGSTQIKDSSLLDLESKGKVFENLHTLCICQTKVTFIGLLCLGRMQNSLKHLYVDGSVRTHRDLKDTAFHGNSSLAITYRPCTGGICSILQTHGCGHRDHWSSSQS